MLRRMLPGVVVLIIGIVWLRLTVQSTGLLDANVASGTVAIILAVEGIVIWNAGELDQLDKVRRRGDEQIRQLNATLTHQSVIKTTFLLYVTASGAISAG